MTAAELKEALASQLPKGKASVLYELGSLAVASIMVAPQWACDTIG